MMLRKFILFSAVFFTSLSSFAQAKLIEKVTKKSANDDRVQYLASHFFDNSHKTS
jgi:hypothetical protein